jgi:hypothetical protein
VLAAWINRWLARIRAARAAAVLTRLVILLAGLFAIGVEASQPWDALDLALIVAVVGLLLSVGAPDTPAPLIFIAAVAVGWLTRGPVTGGWPVLIVTLSLLVVHLACAFAAQFPSYAAVEPAVLSTWLPVATVAGFVAALVTGLTSIIRGTAIEGSLAVTVAALAGTASVVWLVSRDGSTT